MISQENGRNNVAKLRRNVLDRLALLRGILKLSKRDISFRKVLESALGSTYYEYPTITSEYFSREGMLLLIDINV